MTRGMAGWPAPLTRAHVWSVGGVAMPPVAANRFLYPEGPSASLVMAEATLYLAPIFLPAGQEWDQLTLDISGGGASGAVIRAGVWLPGADDTTPILHTDAGTVAAETIVARTWTIALSGVAGLVYVGCACQGAAASRPTVRAAGADRSPFISGSAAAHANAVALGQGSVSGAFGPTASATFAQASVPLLGIRRKA